LAVVVVARAAHPAAPEPGAGRGGGWRCLWRMHQNGEK